MTPLLGLSSAKHKCGREASDIGLDTCIRFVFVWFSCISDLLHIRVELIRMGELDALHAEEYQPLSL